MAVEESQDCRRVARGWEAISRFVCFLYSFKAAAKIVSKLVEEAEVDGTLDIVLAKESCWMFMRYKVSRRQGTD